MSETTSTPPVVTASPVTHVCTFEFFEQGWRPFIGWGLAVALIWQVGLAPAITFLVNLVGYHPTLVQLDNTWISAVLIPMLGLSAMHSFDRTQETKANIMAARRF